MKLPILEVDYDLRNLSDRALNILARDSETGGPFAQSLNLANRGSASALPLDFLRDATRLSL